ncbi:MAG: phospholipase D-like domain-containing protein, partial [Smithellaceae bacterium]|nr:phospholipase D-like domain-containing protein [Smithellaceae bacterium]
MITPNLTWWDIIAGLFATLLSVSTVAHALIHKRDPKGAFGWIATCLLFPIVGPLIYFLFGINRVKRRAKKLLQSSSLSLADETGGQTLVPYAVNSQSLPAHYLLQARVSDRACRRPIFSGNRVTLLHNGEEAYPAMLKAIAEARQCVYLCTYLFDIDETGMSFAKALAAAKKRGVTVRVIVDGIGEIDWLTTASRHLRKLGVPVATHIPPRLIPPSFSINLRNHRKILAVDSRIAFTGGMNIGDRHLVNLPRHP